MDISSLNFLAIFVAALSCFMLGGLWYSGVLFGKIWMRETGITEERANNQNIPRTFGLAFLASLVIAFNLAMFLGSSSTLHSGLFYGFLAGFGWVAMSFAINDLFEQRSFKLFLINASYHTLAFTIMGGIIGAWH
ncbi:DUF1761 domain-containing protein [Gammaproteobacteria bacterium LSUCC0112]|nr:DUF1761 domain-containing protein [Gammaproteobacteria bacterium LSUCC0112]